VTDPAIRLLLADVDGTLVTPDKQLTDRAVAAVGRLGESGIAFALTSGRPPRGMEMLFGPLAVTTPVSAFNGGMVVGSDLSVIEQRTVPEAIVGPVLELMAAAGLSTWVYRKTEWNVLDVGGPHVAHEAAPPPRGRGRWVSGERHRTPGTDQAGQISPHLLGDGLSRQSPERGDLGIESSCQSR
jgi:hydroxymethylpyrimidine pyrophosphatase-like HAD family hydrolase